VSGSLPIIGASKCVAEHAAWPAVKGSLFLILGLLPSLTFASGPGPAALDFLEKARKGELNLKSDGDTALQADNITTAKFDVIRKGLARLGADLGDGELEIGDVKEDEGFAAVMVRKVAGFDPSEIRVYPVALVERGGRWFPAPVLASFENAVSGYTLPVRERLSGLEAWMMEKRVMDLNHLIARSAERTRERIRGSIVGENLEGDDLAGIAADFLKACAAGDRAAILGFLGGLSDPLPEDWAARLAASRMAAEGRGPWRLLVSAEVVRVPVLVEREGRGGMVSIACLDPSIENPGMLHIIHIDFVKDGSGRWRMDLPRMLMSADESLPGEEEGFDTDLLDRFPKRLRDIDPAIASPTARAALDGVLESMKSGSLRDLLRRVDFGKKGKDGRVACSGAARAWWSLNGPGELGMPLELGFREEGDTAAAVFQWFSLDDADRFEQVTLLFRKSSEGWLWSSGEELEAHPDLLEWVKVSKPGWRLSWREKLMRPGKTLGRIGFERVATDAEVTRLISDWMDALENKDIGAALSLSAWLGAEGEIPVKALRNLSYDLADFGKGEWRLEGNHRSGSWAAASVRQLSGGEVRHAFLLVVVTDSGPRLLPEIDLFAADDRPRGFLNESSLKRVGSFAGKEREAELRALFESFNKKITPGK
jgi:hypothetical protein